MDNSSNYWTNRANQQRKMADDSTDPAVASAHRELAERLQQRAHVEPKPEARA